MTVMMKPLLLPSKLCILMVIIVFLVMFDTGFVMAEMSSQNYRIVEETPVDGGGQSQSLNYVLYDTAGQKAVHGESTSTDFHMWHGLSYGQGAQAVVPDLLSFAVVVLILFISVVLHRKLRIYISTQSI